MSAGLPILQYVHRDDRTAFLKAFVQMGKDERTIVAANNAYLAEEARTCPAKSLSMLPVGVHLCTSLHLRTLFCELFLAGRMANWSQDSNSSNPWLAHKCHILPASQF